MCPYTLPCLVLYCEATCGAQSDHPLALSRNLSVNQMTGLLPETWIAASSFQEPELLALNGNQLSGILPDDLHLPALKVTP